MHSSVISTSDIVGADQLPVDNIALKVPSRDDLGYAPFGESPLARNLSHNDPSDSDAWPAGDLALQDAARA